MWIEGVIGVPGEDGKMTGVWYQAKVYDLPAAITALMAAGSASCSSAKVGGFLSTVG